MKIVIVGGGTAGWLAALMISKMQPKKHSITLIESNEIKIIGVGEGSTGSLRNIVNNEIADFDCNEIDFMKFTKSTPKLGIKFMDWKHSGHNYYEPLDGPVQLNFLNSYPLLEYYLLNKIPTEMSSINGRLMHSGLSGFELFDNNIFGKNLHAYHFDSHLAGEYFKTKCKTEVSTINSTVLDIFLDQNGYVEYLLLKNGKKVSADFFIDASGFSNIFSQKMDIKTSKFDELTLNSAIVLKFKSKVFKTSDFYTKSISKKYGWLWVIPKNDSIGCGYIYDDNFIDEDKALQEIKDDYKTDVEIIKTIKFNAQKKESAWNKNVLSIGLSSNFLEPLEATSIHGTISQLNNFISFYLHEDRDKTLNDKSMLLYNESTSDLIDSFKNFILIHYLNSRSDTDFWKQMNYNSSNDNFIKNIVEISKNRLLNFFDIKGTYGSIGSELYNWVICSMGIYSSEKNKFDEKLFNDAKKEENVLYEYFCDKNFIDNETLLLNLRNKNNVY